MPFPSSPRKSGEEIDRGAQSCDPEAAGPVSVEGKCDAEPSLKEREAGREQDTGSNPIRQSVSCRCRADHQSEDQ